MKARVPSTIEPFRLRSGQMALAPVVGHVRHVYRPGPVRNRASGDGVRRQGLARTPNWREMEFVRDLFWEPAELVLQFSVPRAEHINVHPYCLHLWKPIDVEIPMPPALTVAGTVAVSR